MQEHLSTLRTFAEAKARFERLYCRRLLSACRGNVAEAARYANMDRKNFYELMNRAMLDPKEFRANKGRGKSIG